MVDREKLVRAQKAGQLLEEIRDAISPDPSERETLLSDLAALHNERLIDLIEAFSELPERSSSDPDFFLLRHVLEEVLPELEAPVPETANCVRRLYREAGSDMAAGTILQAFQGFCARRGDRVQVALAEIEAAPENLSDLLLSVLVAGSELDLAAYLAEAIRLAGHANLELRKWAILALGHLQWGQALSVNEDVMATIERAVAAENDDQVLACAIKSAFELARLDAQSESRLTTAIAVALPKGRDASLRTASKIFGFHTLELGPELLDLLLEYLPRVQPANDATLSNIDYGVARLLRNDDIAKGLQLLEGLLRAHPDDLDFSTFDSSARTIRNAPSLCKKIATRWFLSGEHALCEGVGTLVDVPSDSSSDLEVDTGELAETEPAQFLFVARKAIGYLILKPIAATSFLLSLLRQAPSDPTLRSELEALLWNPLLINFSGQVAEFLTDRAESEEEPVKAAIRRALDELERYLAGLASVGEIPAVHPSQVHRDAFRRYFTEKMAQSFKKAEAASVIMQLVHRTVLLYGRTAIHHAFGSNGEISRMETHLGPHGTQVEVPRLTLLDPHGLDYMLRIFRCEKMSS